MLIADVGSVVGGLPGETQLFSSYAAGSMIGLAAPDFCLPACLPACFLTGDRYDSSQTMCIG